ncbi:serine/threonine protein kinase [Sulfuricella denitrificans skB26]|uniref:Serine/threonine protein kinase n=1 Tax=Sulfuricella denitrificans (strain DSM 22764 / NBRC 105220 / skB26) TaxID=1163617 RepID=S6AD16_SULDS|nr:bifunctional protein-serine/threonine kinase/phosphatase [Sulfuricella denitrificans]BAN36078.1 serine/threonine protein kinase [Sulfuricella denitrificans skB26]
MSNTLSISLGQHSIAGIKPQNEDFFGASIPSDSTLESKGICVAIADGVSASEGGKEASQIAVRQFLDDYFSTPDSWSTKLAATKILGALNLWLYNQGQKLYAGNCGLATTFSAIILKSQTAHLFHVGDSRIYLLREGQLECLTRDHRVHFGDKSDYLARAMGIDTRLDIDYSTRELQPGDCFILTTDGVHDVLRSEELEQLLNGLSSEPQKCAETVVARALSQGSQDNITCQVVRIETLPQADKSEFFEHLNSLPFPPDLKAGQILDGYRILRELNATSRSQVYLAEDTQETPAKKVVIKTPSQNYNDDPLYIEQFLLEEWVAKRLDSPHLIKVCDRTTRPRTFLYSVVEYIEGQTLRQWMRDNPSPSVDQVRATVDQIARGLRAMHRMEMIHQDLKPDNILIDRNNTLKIIDFGSTRIAGLAETHTVLEHKHIAGTASYSAPEYFRGEQGTNRSDIFSMGVIAYEMFTGKLPYGEISPEQAARKKFAYTPARITNPAIPGWVDAALEKATQPHPNRRYEVESEFVADLTCPNQSLVNEGRSRPLLERNPLGFWKGLSLIQLAVILILGYLLLNGTVRT